MNRRLGQSPVKVPSFGTSGGGGPFNSNAFTIRASDDGTDQSAIMQTQIDAMPDNVVPKLVIINTPDGLGTALVDYPLRFVDKKSISGYGVGASNIDPMPDRLGGPVLVAGAIQDPMPHAAALWTGTTYSWHFEAVANPNPYYFLNLSRHGVYPSGQAQFWYERRFRLVANVGFVYCSCSGAAFGFDAAGLSTYTIAFQLGRDGGGQVNGQIRIGGITYNFITTSTFGPGDETTIAIGYDGTNVYVFADGVLEQTVVTAGGTFTTNYWEEWCEGPAICGDWPGFSISIDVVTHDLAGARLSTTCRETSNYTPSTTPWVSDGFNVFTLTASPGVEVDDFIRILLGNTGHGWLQVLNTQMDIGNVNNFQLEDLSIGTSAGDQTIAVRILGSTSSRLSRLVLRGSIGVEASHSSYLGIYHDITINSGNLGRIGFQVIGSGLAEISDISSNGAFVPFAMNGGIIAHRCFAFNINTGGLGFHLAFAGGTFTGCSATDENNASVPRYMVWYVPLANNVIEFQNCSFENIDSDGLLALIGVGTDIQGTDVSQMFSRMVINAALTASGNTIPPPACIDIIRPIVAPRIEVDCARQGDAPLALAASFRKLTMNLEKVTPGDISGAANVAWFSTFAGSAYGATNVLSPPGLSTIDKVRDLTENGFLATAPAAANRPSLIANAFSSRSCMRFDGVNDHLLSTQEIISGTDPRTLIIVARSTDTLAANTTNYRLFRFGVQGTGSDFSACLVKLGGTFYIYGDGVAIDIGSLDDLSYLGKNLFMAVWRNHDNTDLEFRVNTRNISLGSTALGATDADPGFGIGVPNTQEAKCDIFEVIVMDEYLTDDQLSIHETRLINLYGDILTVQS